MYENTHKDLLKIIELLKKDKKHQVLLFENALLDFEEKNYKKCSKIILSGSKGMGSLNDLVLGQSIDKNGQFKWKDNYKEINNQYQELLKRLYSFAKEILLS